MATINAQTFCGNISQNYGWEPAKARRLEAFLQQRGLYREGVPPEKLSAAVDEFLVAESRPDPNPAQTS